MREVYVVAGNTSFWNEGHGDEMGCWINPWPFDSSDYVRYPDEIYGCFDQYKDALEHFKKTIINYCEEYLPEMVEWFALTLHKRMEDKNNLFKNYKKWGDEYNTVAWLYLHDVDTTIYYHLEDYWTLHIENADDNYFGVPYFYIKKTEMK